MFSMISRFGEMAPDPRVALQENVQAAITADDIETAKAEFGRINIPEVDAPTVKNDAWCQTDIDYHILSGLENAGFGP